MTREVVESKKTVDEVRSNIESQLKAIDKKVESATKRADKLMIERNRVAALLERVNRINVES